jgi:hypothetical protein
MTAASTSGVTRSLGLTRGAPAVSPARTLAKPVRLQLMGEPSRGGTNKNYEAH